MTIQHEDIADPYIHEPKGVAAASADTVYVADGAGSGTWEKITGDSLNSAVQTTILTAVETNINDGTLPILPAETYVYCIIPDISTQSTLFVPVPEDSTLIQARVTLEGPITVADATIEIKTAADVSMGTLVVPFTASAAGDSYTYTPTGNNDLTGPTYIKVSTDGGSTDAQRLFVTLHFYVTRTIA